MKRLSLLGLLAAAMTTIAGCPIYDDSPGGSVCESCNPTTSTSTPTGDCFAQSDCTQINQTCGSDNFCHTGDCLSWGCSGGDECRVGADQKAHCVPPGSGGAGGSTSTGGAGGHGGASGGASMGGTGGVGPAGGASQGGTGGTGGAAQGGAAQGGAAMGGAGGTGGASMGGAAQGGTGGTAGTGGVAGMP